MKLVVGLGNPGKEYEGTRHNVGFLVIDKLINNEQLTISKKLNAGVLKTTLDKKRVVFAKPQTFMNNSGVAVQALLNFYKLKPENLVVIHDDKDVPLGEIRVQAGRGSAGHHGVDSIIENLGTKDFTRIRIGIAPVVTSATPPTPSWKEGEIANFVLNKFTKEEQKILNGVVKNVMEEIKKIVTLL
jgi:PTH1 family peptidyl-tRNA hydrolase